MQLVNDAGGPQQSNDEVPVPTGPGRPHPDSSVQPTHASKQAVVLIHGMGEQIPMDTIKGFVTAVWEDDPLITDNGLPSPAKTWSKPDDRTGSLELRRITTRQSRKTAERTEGVRSDFYELYWADLTAGSTWQQFTSWVWYLLLRWSVPKDVRLAWILLWVLTITVALIGMLGFVPDWLWLKYVPGWLPQKSMIAVFAVAGAGLHALTTRSFGRVVRYTRAQPDNIASRANVRARGLALLRALHDDSYERIVVVGHSLGTILAYDLISYLWAEMTAARTITEGTDAFVALKALEASAAALEGAAATDRAKAVEAYAKDRVALRHALAQRTDLDPRQRWLISDLITLGSPLSHSEFLLAKGKGDLEQRQESRELPTSPPYREELDPSVRAAAVEAGLIAPDADVQASRMLSFPERIGNGRWTLHHAAPYAAVRWTNVFDPSRLVFFGDVISGPMQGSFGPAINEIDLSKRDRKSRRFTHTRYWALDQSNARMSAFREAINLLDADTPREGVSFGMKTDGEAALW